MSGADLMVRLFVKEVIPIGFGELVVIQDTGFTDEGFPHRRRSAAIQDSCFDFPTKE
jgi:hypothetical protein